MNCAALCREGLCNNEFQNRSQVQVICSCHFQFHRLVLLFSAYLGFTWFKILLRYSIVHVREEKSDLCVKNKLLRKDKLADIFHA